VGVKVGDDVTVGVADGVSWEAVCGAAVEETLISILAEA
jgi:hypothetical protein